MPITSIGKITLACFCGFLLSLSAPGYDLWLFAWFGLAPLFIIIYTSRKIKECILYSFIFGFTYNISYLHWLVSLHPLSWLGFSNIKSWLITILGLVSITVYSSLYFILFAVCLFFLNKTTPKTNTKSIAHLLLGAFIWLIIFNKLQENQFLLGFPWTLIEYSQYKNLFLIQIAEYCGSISIGFLIVFFNLAIARCFIWIFNIEKIGNRFIPKSPGQLSDVIYSFSFIVILIFCTVLVGFVLYGKNQPIFTNQSQTICILQGNLPIKATRGAKLDIGLAKKTYEDLIDKNNASLILAPEGALPTIFNSDKNTQAWASSLVNKKQNSAIFGTYCGESNMIANCAVSCLNKASSGEFSFYKKERLVPFGEYTPFSNMLPEFLKKLAFNVIGEGFTPGTENKLTKLPFGKVGINICFELIFPGIIRNTSLKGADLLINLSDLSWFSNNFLKQQFLSFAIFRAIENRKYFVIAANNGISAFIEPTGKIQSQSIPNTQGVLLDWINLLHKTTFYTRYGW